MFNSAPDTPSPVYPDRLIRPLPKRTLRSRLSSEAAESILFPPAPPATQLFYGTSVESADLVNDAKVYVQQSDGRDPSPERDHLPYENGVELESGDEDGPVVVRRSAGFRGSSLSPSTPSAAPQALPCNSEGPPVKSSAAGPDGYDAFENTNNKKKRKIPTPGSLSTHHSTLSPEFSSMGLASSVQSSSTTGEGSHVSTFYGTGSPASPISSGMSGAGRGRLGRHPHRSSTGRNSLSLHSPISWPQTPTRRDGLLSSPTGPTSDSAAKPDQGIISAAIANAAASAFSSPPPGPGIVSMLERQTQTSTNTQFTFTCESDSSKGMALQTQTQNMYPAHHRSASTLTAAVQGQRGYSQGTQTSPNIASQANQSGPYPNPQQPPQQQPPNAGTETPTTGRKKKKRSPSSIYALAARQRKIQQQYANLHHPPSIEDIWICEFCEYESIFGHPPEALIRQYEIKDRKERKRLAEKKRLLEKAKMKGRKGKKATKNASKQAAAQQAAYDQGYDRASADQSSVGGGPGVHDDESLGNEYEDEGIPTPPSGPPSSVKAAPPPGHPPKPGTAASGAKSTADGGTRPP
ncbi:hypothetical protein BO94DRAFT_10964 [Aspergillus sclerotioniger CBS 115572]|uniref:Uncharacterized protein n=1 Tax=Aspergillus sclerotioniger CBS 115572 TaxID=1450535 RepID=A0A317XGK1_9EURO|nr:hypothetical protein BO94DRAFT_10964 [Aspergillus sclerotioniger CBS 115572]PWY96448.1 hypothetical protein BO94DRAFT_10964 [Aspergillus sclerotioniger CBS 115572]